jgi:hypothetical protein
MNNFKLYAFALAILGISSSFQMHAQQEPTTPTVDETVTYINQHNTALPFLKECIDYTQPWPLSISADHKTLIWSCRDSKGELSATMGVIESVKFCRSS